MVVTALNYNHKYKLGQLLDITTQVRVITLYPKEALLGSSVLLMHCLKSY